MFVKTNLFPGIRPWLKAGLLGGLMLIMAPSLHAWGFWAHQRINRLAVYTLPPEMLALYKDQLEYLTEHAVDPDKRRYAIDGEDVKHFIDLDHYGHYPFDNVPRYWKEACLALQEDTLRAYGILPYQLPNELHKLTLAFKEKDLERIMKLSADIGHYIGDGHVPLHTTENYNGQMTGQKGIHGFWESRLPELFGESYDFFVGRAYYVDNIQMEIWDAVMESHLAVDSVLSFERQLNEQYPADKKYGYESRNAITIRTYSREYSAAYHDMLGGQVERRMRTAIRRIGAFWYTAWKNAGSPDLSELVGQKIKPGNVKYKRKLNITDREGISLSFFRQIRQSGSVDLCCCLPNDRPVDHLSLYEVAAISSQLETAPAQKEVGEPGSLWSWMLDQVQDWI